MPPIIAPSSPNADVFAAGDVISLCFDGTSFETATAAIGVGRFDGAAGAELEGARFIGIRDHTGVHAVVLRSNDIDVLIRALEKLKRSPGAADER